MTEPIRYCEVQNKLISFVASGACFCCSRDPRRCSGQSERDTQNLHGCTTAARRSAQGRSTRRFFHKIFIFILCPFRPFRPFCLFCLFFQWRLVFFVFFVQKLSFCTHKTQFTTQLTSCPTACTAYYEQTTPHFVFIVISVLFCFFSHPSCFPCFFCTCKSQ